MNKGRGRSFALTEILAVALAVGTVSVANSTMAATGKEQAGTMPQGPYAVSKVLKVGGEGGFDYATINEQGTRLYLPRTSHTLVMDTANGKLVGDIPDNHGSHGVALVPWAGRGFITNGEDGTVQVFDLESNKALGRIAAAKDADGAIYDPASKRVLIMCGDSESLIPIPPDVDLAAGKADPAIDLGGKPEFAAVDGQGKAYVNLVDKDMVAVVDTKTMTVVGKWPIGQAKSPVGMAIDSEHGLLFIGCRSKQMVVMSTADGHVLATLPIGQGVDATAFDHGMALASCRDGTLTAIREVTPESFQVAQVVKTAPWAKTMAVDPITGAVYLPTANFQATKGHRPEMSPGSFKVLVVRKITGANQPAQAAN